MTVYGWDLSAHDWDRHKVSLANARKAGISLATHKATEGHTFTDPRFADYCRQKPSRFPVAGSYCAAWPDDDKQADHWYETVERTYPAWRDHPCWIWQIDAEPWKNAPRAINLREIDRLGKRIEKLTGCPAQAIPVYAPQWHYGGSLRGLDYRLWSSAYGKNPFGDYRKVYPGDHGSGWEPYSGQTPIIWQYGSATTIGRQEICDANAIRVGSESELQALFGGDDMPLSKDDIDAVADAVLHKLGSPRAWGSSNRKIMRRWGAQIRKAANDNGRLLGPLNTRVAQLQAAVADLTEQVKALKAAGGKVTIEPTDVPVTGTLHIGETK